MSSPSISVRLANLYLCSYALDAVCSTLVLGFLSDGDWPLFVAFQQLLASWVFTMTLMMVGVVALRPRLPMGTLLALATSVFWLGSGGVPIPLWVAPDAGLPLFLALLQVAFAALAFAVVWRGNAGDGFLLLDENLEARESESRRLLRFSALALGVGLPVSIAYGALSLATWIAVETEHFVALDLSGVRLADRRYTRDDQEIRLVGMMHLGEEAVYREIARSFLGPDTIVLEEGVSDEEAVLEESLQYGKVAGRLGLSPQRSIGSYLDEVGDEGSDEGGAGGATRDRPQLRHADVDSRAFTPGTRRLLARAAGVWSDDDFALAFLEMYQELLEDPEAAEGFFYDIIELRNRHLIEHMQRALRERTRVIVPWGALHLPEIEAFVLERGFLQVGEVERHVVTWPTVWRAIRD